MKKLLILLLFALLSQLYANRIDELKTNEDVANFLTELDKNLVLKVVEVEKLFQVPSEKRTADSLGVKPWIKADFDNNGTSDLMALGVYYSSFRYLVIVIDEGNNQFKIHELGNKHFKGTYFPLIQKINGTDMLVIYEEEENWRSREITVSIDTLFYFQKEFIEYPVSSQSHIIDKIEYSTTICFGSCPEFDLTILSDRSATYHAKQYNKVGGMFKGTIDPDTYNDLILWLNYIDFPSLDTSYAINWSDNPTSLLTITYDGGKTKIISDYGLEGTYGLMLVYKKLFSLRENQKWKK